MSKYHIVEPHPTATSPHIYSGRGGAGNKATVPSTVTRGSDATGPASRISLSSTNTTSASQRSFGSGRGGAGNFLVPSERTIFSFDEELERQLRRDSAMAPVYHCGRGGAGNVCFQERTPKGRLEVFVDGSVRLRKDSEAGSANSTSSADSGADVATRNIKRGLSKGWGKFTGVGSYMTG